MPELELQRTPQMGRQALGTEMERVAHLVTLTITLSLLFHSVLDAHRPPLHPNKSDIIRDQYSLGLV